MEVVSPRSEYLITGGVQGEAGVLQWKWLHQVRDPELYLKYFPILKPNLKPQVRMPDSTGSPGRLEAWKQFE